MWDASTIVGYTGFRVNFHSSDLRAHLVRVPEYLLAGNDVDNSAQIPPPVSPASASPRAEYSRREVHFHFARTAS